MWEKRLLVSIATLGLLLVHRVKSDPHTTGIYRASINSQLLTSTIRGEVNIFATDEAVRVGFMGYHGVVQGFPSDIASVRLVVHKEKSCSATIAPAVVELTSNNPFNATFPVEEGNLRPQGTELTAIDPHFWQDRAVVLYLMNGTLAGCGTLTGIEDHEAVEMFVGPLGDGGSSSSQLDGMITGVVSPNLNNFCYFGSMVGLPPNVEFAANCSDPGTPENLCGIQIRTQSSCEADLMQPLETDDEPDLEYHWDWSRYYWTDSTGFAVFANCVNAFFTVESLMLNSVLIYHPNGTAIGCGPVLRYEQAGAPPPPPSRDDLYQSQVYCAYLNNKNEELRHFWGAMFAYQNTETIRHGVIGLAGHLYNTDLCGGDDDGGCAMLLASGTCKNDAPNEILREGQLSTYSDGSFVGTWDVYNIDLEDQIALLRLPNGTIASCDYLKEVPDSTVYKAKTLPQSGSTVMGEIVSTNAYKGDLCSFGFAYGLEPGVQNCTACTYIVYDGKSCDQPGKQLFNTTLRSSPWENSRFLSTDARGVTQFGGCVNTKLKSFDYTDRVVVMRGPDNIATSCGAMEPFDPLVYANGMCDICVFDGFAVTLPDAPVDFGGSIPVTCELLEESATSSLFFFDDCMKAQQEASEHCGCSPQAATSRTARTPVIIGLAAVGFFVVLGAIVAFLFLCRRRPAQGKGPDQSGTNSTTDHVEEQQITERQSQPQNNMDEIRVQSEASVLPMAVAVPMDDGSTTKDTHAALTTKNSMRGGSFWQARNSAAPADVGAVQMEGSTSAREEGEFNESSVLSL